MPWKVLSLKIMITQPLQIIALLSTFFIGTAGAPSRGESSKPFKLGWMALFVKIDSEEIIGIGSLVKIDADEVSIITNRPCSDLLTHETGFVVKLIADEQQFTVEDYNPSLVTKLSIVTVRTQHGSHTSAQPFLIRHSTSDRKKWRDGQTIQNRPDNTWAIVDASVVSNEKCQPLLERANVNLEDGEFCVIQKTTTTENFRPADAAPYYTKGNNRYTLWGIYANRAYDTVKGLVSIYISVPRYVESISFTLPEPPPPPKGSTIASIANSVRNVLRS